ncbi:hypothetical protein [Rhizobium lentis]|uniref:hypothetical protein n=1 Tax=Rhizobium lentis TaxID=1138194 RepID=UPI001A92AF59|nr:hypothetical protein [Rhizobium lentis]MBX5063312.1 hypothetical protein [Rhizobium lentis]MBX5075417.1 hypothetical protein [Rhizobium lentis]QSW93069.1 hypothetical protein J0663_18675 [Rhizobium lentis]
MKVKNITNGPKGVNSVDGPVEIGPGQEVNVEMSEAEVASSKRMKWFEFSGSAASTGDEPKLDRDDLKKQAEELGIEYAPNITTPKLKELIDAQLAE